MRLQGEEKRDTPPFPMRQTKAKEACEQRDRLKEEDNQRQQGEERWGDGARKREKRWSAKHRRRSRWRRKEGWWTRSARGDGWIKEHVRACWEARLTAKHTNIRHKGNKEDEREKGSLRACLAESYCYKLGERTQYRPAHKLRFQKI